MKYIFMTAAVALTLSACSEKTEQPAASAGAASAAPVVFSKAETARPASLPAELAAVPHCSFDLLNDGARGESETISNKARVTMNGWSGDPKATAAPGSVFLEFDGPAKLYATAQRGLKRPDVASAYSNPILQDSGWEAHIDLSAATPGQYKVRVIEVNGANATSCDPHSVLVISS